MNGVSVRHFYFCNAEIPSQSEVGELRLQRESSKYFALMSQMVFVTITQVWPHSIKVAWTRRK